MHTFDRPVHAYKMYVDIMHIGDISLQSDWLTTA